MQRLNPGSGHAQGDLSAGGSGVTHRLACNLRRSGEAQPVNGARTAGTANAGRAIEIPVGALSQSSQRLCSIIKAIKFHQGGELPTWTDAKYGSVVGRSASFGRTVEIAITGKNQAGSGI